MNDKRDVKKILSGAGATKEQIKQYIDYGEKGNEKGQERIVLRCRGRQSERLSDKRKQLMCLDYMIAEVDKRYGADQEMSRKDGIEK